MLDEATLAVNLLSFRLKSFGFERSASDGARGYALFRRTETESESKLRPRLLTLWVAAPIEWLIYDESTDALLLGQDGVTPGPATPGSAVEAAAEAERFTEQGIAWRRSSLGETIILYVPEERAERLASPAGLALLGLDRPA